jgi:hypothetical protein
MRVMARALAAPLLAAVILAGCATEEWVERQYGGANGDASQAPAPAAPAYRPTPATPPPAARAPLRTSPPANSRRASTPEVRRLPESAIEDSRPVAAPGLPPSYTPSIPERTRDGKRSYAPPRPSGESGGTQDRFIVESDQP